MLITKNKIKIKNLLSDNKKIEAIENYNKNKDGYDKKFKNYQSKFEKELEWARNFKFYNSIATAIEAIFDKLIGKKRNPVRFSGTNKTCENMIALSREEYSYLKELCNVAGVEINICVRQSDFLIKGGFEFKQNDFLGLRENILLGLAAKKLITLENDNNNPPNMTFKCDENILFNIIKQFSSFSAGLEEQFQMDEKIEKPMLDIKMLNINSTGYQKLSLGQICMADDFLDYVTACFNGENFAKITLRIKSIFEKNFDSNIDDFDIEQFENICIKKLLELGNTSGKWHQNGTIFKEDLRLNEKLKMLDFYYKELPKLTENQIPSRLRLAFIFSLHTGWCSEYARDIIKQKQMDSKFENLFCAIDALQTYNSAQLDSDNLVNDLRSVLSFMKE